MPRAGGTTHDEGAAIDHHVVDGRFEEVSGALPGLLEHIDGRAVDRAARELQRARARRARAALHDVGVAFDHLYLVDEDRQGLRHDRCIGVGVQLSGRRGAREHAHTTVGEHAHASGLLPVEPRGGVEHRGETDAEHADGAGGTARALLFPPARILGAVEELREERGEVSVVVVRAAGGGRGQLGRGEEVAAPHLGGVELELAREQVERALERRGRLRAPRPAVGARTGAVRTYAARPEPHRRDPVRPARHELRLPRLDRSGAGIRARVAELLDLEPDDRAVAPRVECNLEGEPAPLHRREVETAWLHEAHGTAETPRGRAGDDVWGDTADRLAAEGAADVGRDHMEEVGRETERPRELDSAPVRCLCRRVHREPAVGLGHREDRAPLHGCHRHPRDRERRTYGELGGCEGVGGRGRIPRERDARAPRAGR